MLRLDQRVPVSFGMDLRIFLAAVLLHQRLHLSRMTAEVAVEIVRLNATGVIIEMSGSWCQRSYSNSGAVF